MTEELYQKMYQYVVSSLYDITLGLRIKYNDYNESKEKDTAQNLEVFEYMTSSLDNERKVVDKILDKGVKSAKNFQYIINEENLKRFLTPSAIIPMARDAYSEVKLEEQQENMKKSSL